MERDYMKYYRVIRNYVCYKYELTLPELETLTFLYNEPPFGYDDFNKFALLFPFRKKRFLELQQKGLIVKFREHSNSNTKGRKALYKLSTTGKAAVSKMYDMLEGRNLPQPRNVKGRNLSPKDSRLKQSIAIMKEELSHTYNNTKPFKKQSMVKRLEERLRS